MRDELLELDRLCFALLIRQNNIDVASEVPEHLPTRAAGWGELRIVRNNGDGFEFPLAFRDGFKDRCPLGADCQAIAARLDVAAGVHTAFRRKKSGSDGKMRVGGVSSLFGVMGNSDELVVTFSHAVL